MEQGVLEWLLAVFAPQHPVTMWIAIPAALVGLTWGFAKAAEQMAKTIVAICSAVVAIRSTPAKLRKASRRWRN